VRRVPAQRFDRELLDGQIDDAEEVRANLRDMALANRLLLSNRAILRCIGIWLAQVPAGQSVTMLDVATGAGGLPRAIRAWARRTGRQVRLLASDVDRTVIGIARQTLRLRNVDLIQHDALHMPFADGSIDVVTCAFALHHFRPGAAIALLLEMARVARLGVVVSDVRRSYAGYWGARVLAWGTANRLSRHDGPLSVLRAYTPGEVQALIAAAGMDGIVRAEPVFRLVIAFER
jgi:SAM-dependent methyltransferase